MPECQPQAGDEILPHLDLVRLPHTGACLPQEWEKLWTINKRLIDPVAPRHTAVTATGRVPLTLTNGPEGEEVEIIALHKKNPAVGQKASVRSKVPRRVHDTRQSPCL